MPAPSPFLVGNLNTPEDIAGVALDFDSARNVTLNGSTVAAWGSIGPTSVTVSQANAGQQPPYAVALRTGIPTIHFSPTASTYLLGPLLDSSLPTGDVTIFVVARSGTLGLMVQGSALSLGSQDGGGSLGGPNISYGANNFLIGAAPVAGVTGTTIANQFNSRITNQWVLNSYTRSGGSSGLGASVTFRMQGTGGDLLQTSGTQDYTSAAASNFAIGRETAAGGYFQGDIARIVVYNRALSDSERQYVEQTLAAKYNFAKPIIPTPHCIYRYRADVGVAVQGSSVINWLDSGGFGNSMNTFGATDPLYVINGAAPGKNSIRLNGTTDRLLNPTPWQQAQPVTVFAVLKQITNVANARILDGTNAHDLCITQTGSGGNIQLTNGAAGPTVDLGFNWAVLGIVSSGTTSQLAVNGVVSATSGGTSSWMGPTFGASYDGAAGSFANFEVASLIGYNIDLRPDDFITVTNSLRNEYSI